MSVNSLANATLASLATFSLVKGSSGLRKRSEGFIDCAGDKPIYQKVKKGCTWNDIKADGNDAKLKAYCNKNKDSTEDIVKTFCANASGGTTPRPVPNPPAPNPPAPNPPAPNPPRPAPNPPLTPAAGTPAATAGTISINVTIGDETKAVSIKSGDTLAEIMKQVTEDEDLKEQAGLLGLGFYLFGFIKNFTLTVDGEEVEEPEEDNTASELGIGAGSKVEFEVSNVMLYGLSASCSLCCLAIIGLIVYFMFMQGDGGY